MAGFNDIDIKDRVPRLAYVSDILGREVHTVNQISEAEARKVLDALSADRVSSAWPAAAPVPNE
jgi:RNA polymerase-interacting CarD/CdnL/TRCF family regulator